MRSLYWKIFVSFWLASILIIFTTAWVIGHLTHKSTLPAREKFFMDSYANAAVATYESGQQAALLNWLKQIGISRHMTMFLLSNKGEIIGEQSPPESVKQVSNDLLKDDLDEGIFKTGNLSVSHEILSTSGKYYRLVAVSEKPISYFVQIPWADIALHLLLAAVITGLICYFLSLYLTRPLRSLRLAAKSIGTGKLNTRVGYLRGHYKDEIAELSDEFDHMAEHLEELVHSKERLLQDISHELRSPLARLQIALELARNKTDHAADGEFDRIELECARLNKLIGEILEFSRLEKSTKELHLSDVEMSGLLKEIIKDANYEFGQDSTRVQSGKLIHKSIQIDEKLIHRATENIIRNALHYSPKDQSVVVSLTVNDDTIQINIQDKGPGVPPDQLEKIFSPFYRVDTAREKKTGGFGLGLAIAERAVRLHHGNIKAENRPEGGLLVSIILPAIKGVA